jgi:AraC family transcriptional regulator of adaptative response / DNA-3-methyladenine glycosylase II
VVAKALRLIAAGVLDEGSVTDLARQLHVTERHLRRLCLEQLGAAPTTIAQNRRIHFAKQLITSTHLPFAEIALAAGFGSVRRFNSVIQATYSRAPRDLRRHNQQPTSYDPHAPIVLQLAYTPPYDWAALHTFLAKRAIPGVECVAEQRYQRTILLDGLQGTIAICPVPHRPTLQVTITYPQIARLGTIVERVRRLFDLHSDLGCIGKQLQADSALAELVTAHPGLRVPGAWDVFELAVRAILGQQVSVAAATTMAGRLVASYGEPLVEQSAVASNTCLSHTFPTPARLAQADLTTIGVLPSRAATIQHLAAIVAQQPTFFDSFCNLEHALHCLTAISGIGQWTAHYIALRGLGETDAFPASDLGLLRAIEQLEQPMTAAELIARAEAWRPWRAYAAMYLWQALNDNSERIHL